MVKQFEEVINALEADGQVRVVVFDSAVDDHFLNHSDFTAKIEDLTSLPEGTTGLPPWPDFLVRLTRRRETGDRRDFFHFSATKICQLPVNPGFFCWGVECSSPRLATRKGR
jgi:hypothetical protein